MLFFNMVMFKCCLENIRKLHEGRTLLLTQGGMHIDKSLLGIQGKYNDSDEDSEEESSDSERYY